jgi:siroheme synthase
MKKEVVVIEIGSNNLDFLTIKALKVLERASFVIVKDEIDRQVLDLVKPHSTIFCLEKDSTEIIMDSQELSVVILTTRDSFDLTETPKLRSKDVNVNIIPSVKPYLAYPAVKKIPITKRGVNLGFVVVREKIGEDALQQYVDIAIATNASVVFYNNFFLLTEIVWKLKFGGKGKMPVAVVNPKEKQVEWTVGTAETIEELSLLKCNGESSFVIVGEVVTQYDLNSLKEFEEVFVNKI